MHLPSRCPMSPGALGAPWRALSHDFGACGLPSMPHLSKPWQLDLPRLDLANEVQNFDLCLRNDRCRPQVGHFFRCACISPERGPVESLSVIGPNCPPSTAQEVGDRVGPRCGWQSRAAFRCARAVAVPRARVRGRPNWKRAQSAARGTAPSKCRAGSRSR